MSTQSPINELASFLVDAKRRTYAGLNDDATITNPLFSGSKQLEWQDKDWFYRDVYYGMSLFTGMEVVYFKNKPIWSMSYSGGARPDVEVEEAKLIYAFLRSALMKVPLEFPVRGPSAFSTPGLSYTMTGHGDLEFFWGQEEVLTDEISRYALKFAGGLIR